RVVPLPPPVHGGDALGLLVRLDAVRRDDVPAHHKQIVRPWGGHHPFVLAHITVQAREHVDLGDLAQHVQRGFRNRLADKDPWPHGTPPRQIWRSRCAVRRRGRGGGHHRKWAWAGETDTVRCARNLGGA